MVDISEMSDAELEAFIASRRAPQRPPGNVGYAEDIARAIPRGVRDFVSGTLGMPVDIANLAMRGGTELYNRISGPSGPINGGVDATAPQIPAGGSETFRNAIESGARSVSPTIADALNYTPQTVPGNLTRGAVEIGASAMLPTALLGGAPRTVGRMGTIGGLAGVVGEGVDQFGQRANMSEGARAALRTGATLATAIFGNRSMASQANASRMLGERTAQISPAEWAAARRMEGLANRPGGVPLIGGEPLGPAGGPVHRLTSDVRASPQGGPIDRAIGARQGQVQDAVAGPGGFLERISPDADPAIPAAARTNATQPLYRQADMETVPAAAIDPIIQRVAEEYVRTNLPIAREYADVFQTASRAGNEFQIGPLSTAAQRFADRARLPRENANTLDTRSTGVINEINPQLQQALEAANPTYQQAQERFRQMSPRVDAAQTRADYATEFDRALQAGGSQPLNPLVGARFAQNVRGRTGPGSERSPEFDQRILDAAQARGAADPQGAVRSANDFMDNLAFTNQIPGVGSPTQGRGVTAQEAGQNATSTLARALNVTRGAVLDTARTASTGATQGATYRQLARILASPNGIAEMERLIIANGGNPLTQIQLSNLAATLEAARAGELTRSP